MKTINNGKIFEGGNYKCYANAHINYKDRSIIIDYERCLHASFYYNSLKQNEVLVEMYPYGGDITCFSVKLDDNFHKADISELINKVEELLNKESDED